MIVTDRFLQSLCLDVKKAHTCECEDVMQSLTVAHNALKCIDSSVASLACTQQESARLRMHIVVAHDMSGALMNSTGENYLST